MSLPPVDIPESALTYLPELSRPSGGPLPANLASARVQGHDLQAHREALRGPALDPLHLLLRSTLPDAALRHRIPEEVAAILKAEHDLARSPQERLLDSAAKESLLDDLDLLGDHPPDNTALAASWERVRNAIEVRLQPWAQAA